MFRNILVCTDGSERATKAVRAAAVLAQEQGGEGAQVTLLHVRHPVANEEPFPGAPVEADVSTLDDFVRDRQKAILARTLPLIEEAGVACKVHEEVGDPASIIARVAELGGHDLIVLGSRGLSTTNPAHLGSVAYNVVHGAHCPVLVVR